VVSAVALVAFVAIVAVIGVIAIATGQRRSLSHASFLARIAVRQPGLE